jgi:hypothetical protein
MKVAFIPIAVVATLLLAGCAANSKNAPAATRPAMMSIPAVQATADYWFKQPAIAWAASPDFSRLWDACARALTDDQFEIDQQDQRHGVMTTYPMISKQFFEVWRSDAGTLHETLQDSLETIRRTVRFELSRRPDGTYLACPKVLVEQSSHPERRLTAVPQYTGAFASIAEAPTRITEQGVEIPNRYWYALGRDPAMEKHLAKAVKERGIGH